MDEKFKKFIKEYRISMVIVVLLIFIGFTRPGRLSMSVIERFVGDVTSPVISLASTITRGVSEGIASIVSFPDIIRENKKLKEENIVLSDENRRLSDIVARSEQLKNEYDLMEDSDYKLTKASIIGRPLDSHGMYMVNKGSIDGIKRNDTVVAGIQSSENVAVEGLVGKVDQVGDNWSKISLINQGDIGISFTNIRTQEGGIINSSNEDILGGYSFDYNSDIVAEDRLYTSGLGELYAPRIYIGRVTSVVNDEENMQKNISVQPAVDFEKLNSVLIIDGPNYEESN